MQNDIKLPHVSFHLCPSTLCWLVNSNCTLLITPLKTVCVEVVWVALSFGSNIYICILNQITADTWLKT